MSDEALTAATQSGALAPAWIPQGDTEGTEHIRDKDVQLPRLCLAQKTSDQIDDGKPSYIEGLKFREIFNDLTEKNYGRGPIEVCILRADIPRAIQFRPYDEGGGVIDLNVPLDDPRLDFGPNGELPEATLFYDFIIMILDEDGPRPENIMVLSMKMTALKAARNLNSLIKTRNAPIWAGRYSIQSDQDSNKKGDFAIWKIRNRGWVTEEETPVVKALFESFKTQKISFNQADEAKPDIGGSGGAAPSGGGASTDPDVPF